jgi:serine/threonine protein kinase
MTSESIATQTEFSGSEVWLEALARGTCDEAGFLRAVQMLTRKSPEAGWESLSLLDQYYRRGKITADVFRRVKGRLGNQLLGPAMGVDVSIPLSLPEASQGAPRSPPATVTHTPAVDSEPITPAAPAAPATSITPAAAPTTPAAAPTTPPAAKRAPVVPPPAVSVPPPAAPPPAAPVLPRRSAAPPKPAAPAAPATAKVPALDRAAASAVPARLEVFDQEPVAAPARKAQTIPVLTTTPGTTAPATTMRQPDSEPREGRREVAPGDVLRGRYLIKAVLGRGGTGTVFEAFDRYRLDSPDTGQQVALKVLHAQAPRQLTELRREFQHLQSLSHPNIVRAHEYDRDGDVAFFTMEYLSGLSLSRVLSARRRAPLDRPLARAIIRDIGAALAHAHARGVVHGDLSPRNIFITDQGELRVLDFGAAHDPLAVAPRIEPEQEYGSVAAPRFASCQLLQGGFADARDDLYAFACIAYLLLAGKHPFADRTAVEARDQLLKPARPAGLTRGEWLALRSGLTFDRERRPAKVESWAKAFQHSETAPHLPVLLSMVHVPAPARRSPRVHVLLVVVLALLAGGWWASRNIDSIRGTAEQIGSDANATFANMSSAIARLWGELGSSRDNPVESHVQVQEPPAQPVTTPPPQTRSGATQPSAPTYATPKSRTPASAASPSGAGSRPRIELAADAVEVSPGDPAARIVVHRTGSTRGDLSFSWWTESGTAKAEQDFMSVGPREEHIEDGKSSVSLFVPVVADATRHRSKSFYVVINNPSPEASLGKRTLTMVTIPASD